MNSLSQHLRVLTSTTGIIALMLTSAGCRTSEPLINHWVHSHEEDAPGVQVFRPNTYTFPLSRGREAIELREYGNLIRYAIAEGDGLARDTGSWHLSEDGMLTLATRSSQRPSRYQLDYVDSTVLRLKIMR